MEMDRSLAGWIESFLEHLRYQKSVSEHTLRNYASDLYQFHEYVTRTPEGELREGPAPSQIDNMTVREFLGFLYEKRNSKSSVARKLSALRSFFRFLALSGAIASNPAKNIGSPRKEKRLPEYRYYGV